MASECNGPEFFLFMPLKAPTGPLKSFSPQRVIGNSVTKYLLSVFWHMLHEARDCASLWTGVKWTTKGARYFLPFCILHTAPFSAAWKDRVFVLLGERCKAWYRYHAYLPASQSHACIWERVQHSRNRGQLLLCSNTLNAHVKCILGRWASKTPEILVLGESRSFSSEERRSWQRKSSSFLNCLPAVTV